MGPRRTMKGHIFLLCLVVGQLIAEDCFTENVKLKGKLLTKKKTKKNSIEDCLELCEETKGCVGVNYIAKNHKKKGQRKKCLMYKKIKKTTAKKAKNIISAIVSNCLESTTTNTIEFTTENTVDITTINTVDTTTTTDSTCKCGVKKHGTRIVGGSASEVNEYPWMVLLSMGCGGSVIGDRWILTAAHCFYRNGQLDITDPSAVTITLGEHDRSITTETLLTKEVTPDQIIIHESYDPFSNNVNDLALLRLPSAIDLNIYTPVCLPPQGEDFTNKNVWVYGWGSLSEGAFTTSQILQELEISVVADAPMKNIFGLTNDEVEAMVFAGGEEGKDACQGDSGGPLSYDNNGQHQLVGATSWGFGCARPGYPGVYTEISAFRNWIDGKIGDANTC